MFNSMNMKFLRNTKFLAAYMNHTFDVIKFRILFILYLFISEEYAMSKNVEEFEYLNENLILYKTFFWILAKLKHQE